MPTAASNVDRRTPAVGADAIATQQSEGGGAAYAMWSEIEHFNMRANEQD